jgi:glycosyltransferase involved in cell wall biosynthesis
MNMPSGGDNSSLAETSAAAEFSMGQAASSSNTDGRRLKVLVLDEEIPFPLNSGKRIRTWNLLRNLCQAHTITFLCYGTRDNPGFPRLEELGIRVVLVQDLPPSNSFRFYAGALANIFSIWPYSVSRHHTRKFTRAIRALIAAESFDLVHCEWTPYASYINAVGRLPMLIMAHNIEATVWRRRAQHASNLPERLFMGLQAWKMAHFEKKCFTRARQVAVVSEEERQTARQWGARAAYLVSNGVDTEYLHPTGETPEPDSLLFLGSLDWQPNRDALQYLLREILPRIQATNPRTKLRVVGRQPASKLREQVEGLSGVEWVGEVPDIRPHFARAAVVLVPLRIGGGSRIKILESMSMGKAVVATQIGAEGLDVISGVHCLIADSPTDFSQSVAQLLDDPERAIDLGRKGRELVLQQYDWGRMAKILEQAWIETASPVQEQSAVQK